MQNEKVKKYSEQLKDLGIEHEILEHPRLESVLDVQDYLGLTLADGFSTLVMKADGKFVSVIRRDDTKLNFKKIKTLLKVKNLEIASAGEFTELTGLEPGTAHALIPVKKTLLDKKLFEKEFLTGGSGSFTYTFKYKSEDLRKIPGSEIVGVAAESEKGEIRRVLSGITPSGNLLHLGNYAGAVKPQFDLQGEVEVSYYFVADLHALTTIQNKEVLEKNIMSNVLDYIALGLDPEKSVYFRQSDVPEHSMLAIVLANYVPFGLTSRMHAFKDKLAKSATKESINMGLFNYPILMAADILLYKPDGIPVGEDQRQHIEFAREVARNFNNIHGELFPIPKALIRGGGLGRVVGTDGERKMSKSLKNTIDVFGEEKIIREQIMNCFTDPNRIHADDPGRVDGNPIFIYHDIINDDKGEVGDLKERYIKGKVGDVEVKEKLFEAHKNKFGEARERRKRLEDNTELVKEVLDAGAKKAREFAQKTIGEVYEVIGIINKLNK